MNKLIEFVNKYGLIIILSLSLVSFFKTCSSGQKLKEANEISKNEHATIDSLIIASHLNAPNKSDIILMNNEMLKEYNMLVFAIVNNKITSEELTNRLKLIETKLKNKNNKNNNN
jgi:hypothetical protein